MGLGQKLTLLHNSVQHASEEAGFRRSARYIASRCVEFWRS
jgi:hypothetical protein